MKKRGQIFILAALILILVIFLLATQSNVIRERLFADKFEDITRNYETEGNKLINSVLESQTDPSGKFEMFSDNFVDYSTAQNPGIGTAYILNYEGTTNIGIYNMQIQAIETQPPQIENCISQYEASVSSEGLGTSFDIAESCEISYTNINQITITTTDGFTYTFDVEAGKPQLNLVVKKDEKDQTRVYYKKD